MEHRFHVLRLIGLAGLLGRVEQDGRDRMGQRFQKVAEHYLRALVLFRVLWQVQAVPGKREVFLVHLLLEGFC